ncbi:MAG: S-layer homology domain-containing protein [Thermaerobacterales bacterium]
MARLFMFQLRRLGAAGLALGLAAALALSAPAQAAVQGHWAQADIESLQSAGIIEGYPDGSFRPDAAVTRAEFIALLNRAASLYSTDSTAFSDVSTVDWFSGDVAAAVSQGYAAGYPDETFRPHQTVSRQEAAVLLGRFLDVDFTGDPAAIFAEFADQLDIPDWAADYLAAVIESGWLAGDALGQLLPDEPLTRAQAAALIQRVLTHLRAVPVAADYEVWALDQGRAVLHIFNRHRQEIETVDLAPHGIQTPHMISFTSNYDYAFIANTGSGNTAILRTADREVIEVLDTGAVSHFAGVSPDDSAALVDVIGDAKLVEINIDLDAESFTIGRELVLADDPLFAERSEEFPATRPICHDYTADGAYAYITLGPGLGDGGLGVFDLAAFEFTAVYPASEVQVNCGTARSKDGSKMYLTGGSLDTGLWYAFDAATHQPLVEARSTMGQDAHGVAVSADGNELWIVNRASSNGVIVDTANDNVIHEIEFVGQSPDIIAMSPDGRWAFVTLRGPNPKSGPHAIHGDTPGVAVLNVRTRQLVRILEPAKGDADSDFHGVGVRVIRSQ